MIDRPKMTPEQLASVTAACAVPPTPEVLFTKPKGGTLLTYVDSVYIIDRLNDVFGTMGWGHTIDDIHVLFEEKDGDSWICAASARVTLTVCDSWMGHTDVAVGHGKSKRRGDALESALKEAPTDALKRCARFLGKSMGLALYSERDRTGIFVDALMAATTQAALEKVSTSIARLSGSFNEDQLSTIRESYTKAKAALK